MLASGNEKLLFHLKDADMDVAIQEAASAIFFNQGQACCAGSRLYVEEAVFDQVVEGVARHASKIKVSSGLDPQTQMGPLISDNQLRLVSDYVASGLASGATLSPPPYTFLSRRL